MGDLKDLEVDRVDAVDAPATRRRFLIVKDEAGAAAAAPAAPADPKAEIQALLDTAGSALGIIEKSASFAELDGDVADALDALAKAAGVNPFAQGRKRKAPEPAAAAADKTPEAKSEAGALDVAALGAAIGESIAKSLAPIAVTQEAILKAIHGVETLDVRTTPPPSGQPAGQAIAKSGGRKLGEGMFTNVMNGN